MNDSRRTPGCFVSAAPASGPSPCTTLKTPAGRPASAVMSASSDAVEWRPLRRLGDDRVARCECGSDSPGGQHQRCVPWRDDSGDARRVPGDAFAVTADLAIRMRELAQHVGEVAEVHPDAWHHAASVRPQQRAVVTGLDEREFLGSFVDLVGDGIEGISAVRVTQRSPGRECILSRPYCGIDLLLTTGRDLRDRCLVDGRDVSERVIRGDPTPRRSSAVCRRPRRRPSRCVSQTLLSTSRLARLSRRSRPPSHTTPTCR